jgi:acyl-CoA synthetase (AMP-forming)/AMP-acid ligase II
MTKLADMIKQVLALDPAAPELEYEARWTSWGDLGRLSAGLDQALTLAGLGQTARVGALVRNRMEMVGALLAIFSTERCLATFNAHAPDQALAADLAKGAPPVVIAVAEDWARAPVREAVREIGALGLELTGDPAAPVRTVPGLEGRPDAWVKPFAEGVAIEMLTSGTTGAPKRIPLAYRNFEQALLSAASYERGRGEGDAPRLRSGVTIVTAPMAHIAGITGVMNNILAGRKICLIDRFTVEAYRDAILRHRPKVATAPPSALRMFMDANVPKEDISSLVAWRCGTAPLDPDLADAFYERYGIPVLQNYGATEFAGGAAGWTIDDFKAHYKEKRGSVGRINKGIEAQVVDPETGAVLAPGAEGLLELRGGNIGDGKTFVRTTDLAVVDADQFLYIRGRYDGAIIRGGFKILPDDVVKAMQQHPAIREAAVVGVPDERLGQVPAAAYIVKSGATPPAEDELRAFLKERLNGYQIPVYLKAVDELPRTPSLKVSQPALKAMFEAQA